MDQQPRSLASPTKPSALPRPSKLPRPQSVAICNDLPPVQPQRAPLQKIHKPQAKQSPWPPTRDGTNARQKGARHLSQQENSIQLYTRDPVEVESSEQSEGKHFRKPRPSLSDRAIETISQIPPSPATSRRRSSFFSPQSPMTPRPQSALADRSRTIGVPNGRMSPMKSMRYGGKPSNVSSSTIKTPSKSMSHESTTGYTPSATKAPIANLGSPKKTTAGAPPTFANEAFHNAPTKRHLKASTGLINAHHESSVSAEAAELPKSRRIQSHNPIVEIPAVDEVNKFAKSSAALREYIAQAKAARHAAAVRSPASGTAVKTEFWNQEIGDPFNQTLREEGNILLKRINSARLEGYLNISSMSLKALPTDVLRMYDSDVMEAAKVPWSRAADLVRATIADNEIVEISDDFFPLEARLTDDASFRVSPFCSVETLDLHGNLLSNVPVGLGQLEKLTSLNLSRNKLDNSVFDVLSQLKMIRELCLAENDLTREVPQGIATLQSLESLDLHGNKITALPRCLGELVHLRVINVSNNRLSSLPMDVFGRLPLRQIIASTNALTGALFDSSIDSLPLLEMLDVSSNSIASLSFNKTLNLPALIKLNVSQNRLTALPEVSSWKKLVTLLLEGNGLVSLPVGFTSLSSLKTANFNGNSLTKVDEGVAEMTALDTLALSGNPLREKKFLSMSTDDLKRDLQKRWAFNASDEQNGEDVSWIAEWSASPNGVLDLSAHLLEDLNVLEAEDFVITHNSPRSLVLAQNKLARLPVSSLIVFRSTLTTLDVSRNALSELYITGPLLLPFLRDLNMSGNKITSFDCLQAHLTAPSLANLDISRNRLAGSLPHLRETFGKLTQLSADDNAISEASADALFGMEVVSLRGNDLTALDPEIGLLGDVGLRSLEVRANKFRVPNHVVLNKGTQAVLEWLRMKIPRPS